MKTTIPLFWLLYACFFIFLVLFAAAQYVNEHTLRMQQFATVVSQCHEILNEEHYDLLEEQSSYKRAKGWAIYTESGDTVFISCKNGGLVSKCPKGELVVEQQWIDDSKSINRGSPSTQTK